MKSIKSTNWHLLTWGTSRLLKAAALYICYHGNIILFNDGVGQKSFVRLNRRSSKRALRDYTYSVPLELVNLYVYQINVVLPGLAEAILEVGVVVRVHLVALQVDLERSTLLHSLVSYVVEPFVAYQLDCRCSEVRVELEH